mmetsp:Transcript_9295/g.13353  ORF Transcript_9295/g.13353 Transcript_9295/m.13353 type:complete len:150 (+) Transcript_9295:86-535(+)
MGRARRNQRDAIRKSRAKRRSRGKNTSDDSSGDDEGQPRIQHIAKKARISTAARAEINSKREEEEELSSKVSSTEETGNITTAAASSTELHNTAPIKSEEHKETNKSEWEPKATPKKPIDKIDRMRLKKQQQKARRKEKKAAREAAHSK